MSGPLRQSPIQDVSFIEQMALRLDRLLDPHFKRSAEVFFQFDHFEIRRDIGPVVMPAYYVITLFCIVTMRSEAAGLKLKFDTNSLLRITSVTVRDAVRISCANLVDTELKAFGEFGE